MKINMEDLTLDRVVAAYDARYTEQGILRESDAFYKWILAKLDAKPDRQLLDVASGEGYMLKMTREKGLGAVGIDFSTKANMTAKKHADKGTVGDGQRLPFSDNTFDYVTNIGSLEHFFDPKLGLHEMRRVLRPDGKAALILPNSFYLVDIIWHVWRTGYGVSHKQVIERFATKNEWNDLIENEGFRVRRIYKYNLAFPQTKADLAWYGRHPRKILNLIVSPFIPTNLSYSFLYIAEPIA